MTQSETDSRRNPGTSQVEAHESVPAPVSSDPLAAGTAPKSGRILPYIITLVAVMLAAVFGWAMWNAYMGAPWTRDGTVRAYVVTMAPEKSLAG